MKQVSVLIIEDDFLIAERIKAHLKDFGYHVVATIDNGIEAIQAFLQHKPDLVLMDIDLKGDLDGVDVAEEIKKTANTPIIYITGNESDHVFKRVKSTDPSSFIYKPIHPKMLHRNMELAILQQKPLERHLPDSFFFKDEHQYLRIDINEIIYVKADGYSCHIYSANQKKMTISMSLNNFLEKANHKSLVRVHRTYAINVTTIKSVIGGEVLLESDVEVPVGKSYLVEFKKRLHMF